jgi:hypothetical protein
MVGWIHLKEIVLPNTSGCVLGEAPPKWGYLEFLFQAIYDLLVFLLCMIKVDSTYVTSMRAILIPLVATDEERSVHSKPTLQFGRRWHEHKA